MTTVTVSFKGTHEKILEEIVDLGIGQDQNRSHSRGALKLRSYQWDNAEREDSWGDSQTGKIHSRGRG